MAILAFDTHKAVKALCNAGFNGDQAEAVVEQINGAVNENVATKADLAQLATKEALQEEVAKLATKEELREAVAKLATKEEIAKLATKEELREAVAKLATKEELREAVAKLATREELEKLELRLLAQMQKQANTYLKYLIVFAAAVVGLSKMLDILIG